MRKRLILIAMSLATASLIGQLTSVASSDDKKPGTAYTPAQLTERAVHRCAVEAVIWGMPAVNYDLMLQQALKYKGEVNQVIYWSKPVDWKNQTLTPNPDSIYFMIFWNTKEAGPVVIDVPPAGGGSFAGNIVNIWQMPLEDAGPEGADQGKGGRYLILPPGYKEKPPQGYVVLRADTYGGYALMRSNLGSHANADVAKSVAYGKRLRVYPLSRASNPGETKFTDMIDVIFDSTIPYNTRFFESLDHIIQNDVWLERDRVMIDQLKSIGIEKGKPFKPDAKAKEILDSAIQEAKAWFELKCEVGFPPLNPGIHWGPPALTEIVKLYQSSYTDPDHYPVGSRGFTYTLGYIGIKRLGTAQFYLMTMKDKDGDDFDGSRTYRLTVPANAPVKQYWSATVYDRATHALIRDLPRASRASNNAEVRKNADGSVDIYFGPRAPAGKEANWVPTNPKGKFEVLFRLYGPEKPLFDKTWKLPDIEKVK